MSTKMHVSRSPIARWMMSAATVESTPPLSAADHAARRRPVARIRAVASSTNDAIVQSPVQPHTPVGEVAQNLEAAFGVHDFRMEQQRVEPRSRSAIAATGALALVATTLKPAGAAATKSP